MARSTCVKKCMTKPRSRKTSTKSKARKTSTKSRSRKTATKSRSTRSKKACTLPAKRYIVLKCAKVSSKKSISSQGKVVTMKCTSTTAAGKVATAMYKKTGRQMKTVYLYRKGKVTKFSIVFKTSKTTGKKVAKAKSVRKTDVKMVKKSNPCKKSRKTLKKRCPSGSRRSINAKMCLQNDPLLVPGRRMTLEARSRSRKNRGLFATLFGKKEDGPMFGPENKPLPFFGPSNKPLPFFGPANKPVSLPVFGPETSAEEKRNRIRKAIAQRDENPFYQSAFGPKSDGPTFGPETAAQASRRKLQAIAAEKKMIAAAAAAEKKRRFAAAQKAIAQRDDDEKTMAALAEKRRRFAAAQKAIAQRDADEAAGFHSQF